MLLRQWRLVRALHGRRRGARIADLIDETAIARSTLYRDLRDLAEAGLPLAVERINGEARYSLLGEPLPVLGPSALELAALRVARTTLGPLEGTDMVEALDGLLRRFGVSHVVGAGAHTDGHRETVGVLDREGR